jgi:hypothetical protein
MASGRIGSGRGVAGRRVLRGLTMAHRWIHGFCAWTASCFVAMAVAGGPQAEPATPRPARDGQPAVGATEPDLSTALSAALAWYEANWKGDANAAHKVLVDDAAQREYVAAGLRYSAALNNLEAAAAKQFKGVGRRVTDHPNSARLMERRLEVQEDGDRATVTAKNMKMPIELRRIDGRWRVDLSAAMRDPGLARADGAYNGVAAIAEEMTREVAAGAFKSADDVRKEFTRRRRAAAPK